MRNRIWVLIILFFPFVWLLPFTGDFLYVSSSEYNDIAVSHLPNAIYFLNCLAKYHTVPLWSDTILSGYPFASNPLSGLFYPPGWLALFFPLPLGFNLDVILHLIFGGLGIYLWLRKEGYNLPASLTGALIFELMPKIFAHFAAGHITLVYSVCWIGWLLLAENYRVRNLRKYMWIFPGIVWGMILLADLRWGAYAGVIWVVYGLWVSFLKNSSKENTTQQILITDLLMRIWDRLKGMGLTLILGCAIASPSIIPLLEYVTHSTRQVMGSSESMTFSLPFGNLLGLFFSTTGGNAEYVLYPGIVTLILVSVGLLKTSNRGWTWFWLAVAGASILLAFGSNIPLATTIYSLPGFNLLRVPARALFLLGLAFSALGADGIQTIIERHERGIHLSLGLMVGILGFVTMLTLSMMFMRIDINFQFVFTMVFAWIAGIVVLLYNAKKIKSGTFTGVFISLLVIDLSLANATGIKVNPAEIVLNENEEVLNWLTNQDGTFRIYSPSYSLPQQSAARANLQLADGVDPMQLTTYIAYMESATGVPSSGYSVTLPPYANGEPAEDNKGYTPDAQKLGLLNVLYVVAEYDLANTTGFEYITKIGNTRIYVNQNWLPRAWVQPDRDLTNDEYTPVTSLDMEPNQIEIEAEGPGTLVLSEIVYPGWEVLVDNEARDLLSVEGLLRGVEIGVGVHQVVFRYRPVSVYIGVIISLFAWIMIFAFYLVANKAK